MDRERRSQHCHRSRGCRHSRGDDGNLRASRRGFCRSNHQRRAHRRLNRRSDHSDARSDDIVVLPPLAALLRRALMRDKFIPEPPEEILSQALRHSVDQAGADLRQPAADLRLRYIAQARALARVFQYDLGRTLAEAWLFLASIARGTAGYVSSYRCR